MTKFLIIGDLHGNKPKIHFKDFDAIIAPGDFCSDAPRQYMFEALRKNIENPKEEIMWYDITGKKKAKAMIQKSLKDGRKILEFLNSFNVPLYTVPGNWDWTSSKKQLINGNQYKNFLIKGLKNIKDTFNKKVYAGEYELIGYGETSGPEYPQHKDVLKDFKKKDLKKAKNEYKKIFNRISKLFDKSKKPVIFMSHNVPFNTKLDKITNKTSPRYGYHYGSVIVREIILKYKPLLCIGGHMHEHFTKCKLEKTLCINAGFGGHVNTLLTLENGKIKSVEFYPKEYG